MSLHLHPNSKRQKYFSSIAKFEYFDIDLSDIWRFESRTCREENLWFCRNLYYDLKQLYLQAGLKPFAGPAAIAPDKHGKEYYEDYLYNIIPRIEKGFLIDFFEFNSSIYYMLSPCIIRKGQVNFFDFMKLFAFKLRQYETGFAYLKDLLRYHWESNFNYNTTDFISFLKNLINDYQNLLSQNLIDHVKLLISEAAITFKIENIWDPEERSQVPADYKIVEGKFSREETIKFFSFLYLEKSNNNKPFLDKQVFNNVFKFGIVLPPDRIPVHSYRLNYSHNFPKAIIEYGIHKFFEKHNNTPEAKRSILLFFAMHFEDFNKALKSEKDLINMSKNITGEKPKRMNFDINEYIPDRILSEASNTSIKKH